MQTNKHISKQARLAGNAEASYEQPHGFFYLEIQTSEALSAFSL